MNVKHLGAEILPFHSGRGAFNLTIPKAEQVVTPSVKTQSQKAFPFPCPKEIAKPFIEMEKKKKSCSSEGLQAFLLCLFLLSTPKKEAA